MSDPDSSPPASVTDRPLHAVRWDGEAPVIVDQRALPGRLVEWRLDSTQAVVEAIASLAVRGAPAIGIAAGYGVAAAVRRAAPSTVPAAHAALDEAASRIRPVRPTAVNLAVAIDRVRAAGYAAATTPEAVDAAVVAEAIAIHEEDRQACARIGAVGARLLEGRRRILTHCHTGRLATGGDGTALGVVYELHAQGRLVEVLVPETRPLLQGSRLTAWELGAARVPCRLLVDGAAGPALRGGLVDAVVVGCDRVAANGDTANKIGTYALAVLARHHGIPFYVAGPLTSIDPSTPSGGEIRIEERSAEEVRRLGTVEVAPSDAPVWNPAFDVTPAELITGFITDGGLIQPPFTRDALAGASMEIRA